MLRIYFEIFNIFNFITSTFTPLIHRTRWPTSLVSHFHFMKQSIFYFSLFLREWRACFSSSRDSAHSKRLPSYSGSATLTGIHASKKGMV